MPGGKSFCGSRMSDPIHPLDPIKLPGIVLYADAGSITGIADGSPVASWPSIVGPSLIQATGAKQPLYRVTGMQGFPSVQFDGIDDSMTADSIAAQFSGVNIPYAAFFVFRRVVAGSNAMGSFTRAANNTLIMFGNDVNAGFERQGRTSDAAQAAILQQPPQTTNARVMGYKFSGQQATNFGNGWRSGINALTLTGTLTLTRFTVGSKRFVAENRFFNGLISTVIIFTIPPSDYEMQRIDRHLMQKYQMGVLL